jgi:hypothetical protein
MSKRTFYGTGSQSALSYLEFGSIDLAAGKKQVWDFRLDQKAYDWLMLARYANDLAAFLELTEKLGKVAGRDLINLYRAEVHHPDDASLNLAKLTALAVAQPPKGKRNHASFLELGQTLFGCIEGMQFCNALLHNLRIAFPRVDLARTNWRGVDISPLFNRLALQMHAGLRVSTRERISEFKGTSDVFFAKGVTLLYAVRSPRQLVELLDRGRLAIFDYSFSLDGAQQLTLGTGKQISYFPLADFCRELSKSRKRLFVRKGRSKADATTQRVFVDCVYGEERMCQRFLALDGSVRRELAARKQKKPEAALLLETTPDGQAQWVPIEEFVEGIR